MTLWHRSGPARRKIFLYDTQTERCLQDSMSAFSGLAPFYCPTELPSIPMACCCITHPRKHDCLLDGGLAAFDVHACDTWHKLVLCWPDLQPPEMGLTSGSITPQEPGSWISPTVSVAAGCTCTMNLSDEGPVHHHGVSSICTVQRNIWCWEVGGACRPLDQWLSHPLG